MNIYITTKQILSRKPLPVNIGIHISRLPFIIQFPKQYDQLGASLLDTWTPDRTGVGKKNKKNVADSIISGYNVVTGLSLQRRQLAGTFPEVAAVHKRVHNARCLRLAFLV